MASTVSTLTIAAQSNGGGVRLRFPVVAGLVLEQTEAIPNGSWTDVPFAATPGAEVQVLELPASAVARFFRLRLPAAGVTTITETSPLEGEAGVAVTRETRLYFSGPLAVDATLDTGTLYATFGGRRVLSRVELSSDRRQVSLFYLEPLPASARISVWFDASRVRDAQGALLDPDGTGQPGGVFQLEFETLSLSTLPSTAVEGTVYAADQATDPNGARVDVPLEGVTITVDGAEDTLRATTDRQGRFHLEPVPPGRFFVHIDGRTARGSQYPAGAYYPAVGKAWLAVAGVTNQPAGGTGVIYLPLIQSATLQSVSPTAPTTIGFPAEVTATQPALADVRLTVPANALFADDGARGGKVGIAPVPPDRLPGPLPDGLRLPLVITVQTDGALNFDQPASICFPNLPDPVLGTPLPPGSQQALVSFDHKRGIWVASGSMTVSEDGKLVCTDPGSGIRQPGWHGVAPTPFRSPPPPVTEQCTEDDAGAQMAGQPELAGNSRRKRKNCNCKPDQAMLDDLIDNCTKLLNSCLEEATAKGLRGRQLCADCLPAQFPGGCTTPAGKRKQDRCFKRNHLAAIERRFQCYKNNRDCIQSAYRCAGPRGSLARPLALMGNQASIEARIVELSGAAEDLLQPFVDVDLEIPDAVIESVRQLDAQANVLAGGDAAAYLEARYAEIAAEFGESAATFEPGNAPEYPVNYAATILRGDTLLTLRGQTEAYGQYAIFVPRDGTLLDVQFFDARTGGFDIISPVIVSNRASGILISNRVYQLPRFQLLALSARDPDGDGDGLPDEVEVVLGTDPEKADSDADGLSDGAEVRQNTDPLDGRVARTGVIATARTPGPAVDVWAGNELVVTAEGASGISVFRPFTGSNPTIASHLPTSGAVTRVGGSRGWIVTTEGSAGISIFRATNASSVVLHRHVALAGAQAIAADPVTVYLGMSSGQIAAVDLESGQVRAQASVVGAVQDLALEGDRLYALTADRLTVFRLSDDGMVLSGLAPSPFLTGGNRRLFVGGGFGYAVHRRGFNTFDLSDPPIPVLRSQGETAQFGWLGLVSNGSGTGVAAVGPNSTDDGPHDVSLYDLRDPAGTNRYVTTFPMPGIARAVTLLNGLAYAAADRAGLQVVNYLPYDALGIAPNIRFPAGFGTNGLEEGKLAAVTALATDDVQVRQVEFYLDGQLIETDGAFPFEFRFLAPLRTPTNSLFTLRARAVDTGGNATWSEELKVSLLLDRTRPTVRDFSPFAGARSVDSVRAFFNEPLDPLSVSANSLRVISAGPDGEFATADDVLVPNTTVRLESEGRSVVVDLAGGLSPGLYQATVAPNLADPAGNTLAEAFSWKFRVADAVFWTQRGQGVWKDPLSWSAGTVPGTNDHVIIDVPGQNIAINLVNEAVAVRSLSATANLAFSGGSLVAPGGIDVRGTLSLDGTVVRDSVINLSPAGRMVLSLSATIFDHVTVNGDIDLTGRALRLRVRNGLRCSGTVRVGGLSVIGFSGVQTFDAGSVVFTGDGGHLSVDGNATLTLGPNTVVRGKNGTLGQPVFAGGSSTLINQGLISSDVAGGTLTIHSTRFQNASIGRIETHNGGSVLLNSDAWVNAGTIVANGGTLTLDGAFENTGSLTTEAATLSLNGDFTLDKLGSYQRAGGAVYVRSVLDLRGTTLNLDATTGSWTLDGGRILGGTVQQSEAGRLVLSGNVGNALDAVTVHGDLDLSVGAPRVHVFNGLTLDGRVLLGQFGVIGFAGVQTLDTGSVVFTGDGGHLSVDGNATLTLASNMVVRGKSGTIGQPVFAGGGSTLINQGLISADVAGGTLAIHSTRFQNTSTGRVETHNGGSVLLNSGAWVNAGSIVANGGTLTLDGAFENTGTLRTEAATLSLDGDFTLAKLGSYQRTGGSVFLRSLLDLRGTTLNLDGATGSWTLDGGRILGGTIQQTDSGRLIMSGNVGNALDAVTVHGDLDLSVGSPRVHVFNGLTLDGRVLLGQFGVIGFAGVQTFDTGSVVFTGDGGHLSVDGNATLTLGPNMVVRGKTGTIGQPVFVGGSSTLINQGLISADVAGGTLTIRANVFQNTGRLEEKNGGRLVRP
ncbi:MAG: Ig-like domain-containing protein [Verrucomicrobiales bacterium]|nr:Ig-like domain-containing protein [Verrucomicrobiales bacterium]